MSSTTQLTMTSNTSTASPLSDIITNIDAFFVLMMAILIFFMQCGFAFLEAGSVRSKNTTNILLKNFLDAFISGLAYWSIGYAFAFGPGNSFIGYRYFFSESLLPTEYHMWFFHFVFAATAATIVSGAMAERCEFIAYVVYSFGITGVVYPIVSHWAWSSQGWLSVGNGEGANYQDFAGSGVVHLLGGTAAFCGAAILRPRIGRFDDETGKPKTLPGHSIPLVALGGFILLFGFFAFNGGSQASISQHGDGAAVSRSILNTVLAGSFAAISALVAYKIGFCCKYKCKREHFLRRPWSLLRTINAALTGMVAACAGCNVLEPWSAAVVGVVAGMIYLGGSWLILKMKVDDPLDAVAVHGFGGLWGLISQPLLKMETGIVFVGNTQSGLNLAWNLAGAAAIIGWTAVITSIMFGILKAIGVLRVDRECEIKGMDIPKHGEAAYPDTAYGDGWLNNNGSKLEVADECVMKEKPKALINGVVTETDKSSGLINGDVTETDNSSVTRF